MSDKIASSVSGSTPDEISRLAYAAKMRPAQLPRTDASDVRGVIYIFALIAILVSIAGTIVQYSRSTEPVYRDVSGVVEFSGFITPARVSRGDVFKTRVRLLDGRIVPATVPKGIALAPGTTVTLRGYTRFSGPPSYSIIAVQK